MTSMMRATLFPSCSNTLATQIEDRSAVIDSELAVSSAATVLTTVFPSKKLIGLTFASNSARVNVGVHFDSADSPHSVMYRVLKKSMPSAPRLSSRTNFQFSFGKKLNLPSTSFKSSRALSSGARRLSSLLRVRCSVITGNRVVKDTKIKSGPSIRGLHRRTLHGILRKARVSEWIIVNQRLPTIRGDGVFSKVLLEQRWAVRGCFEVASKLFHRLAR